MALTIYLEGYSRREALIYIGLSESLCKLINCQLDFARLRNNGNLQTLFQYTRTRVKTWGQNTTQYFFLEWLVKFLNELCLSMLLIFSEKTRYYFNLSVWISTRYIYCNLCHWGLLFPFDSSRWEQKHIEEIDSHLYLGRRFIQQFMLKGPYKW